MYDHHVWKLWILPLRKGCPGDFEEPVVEGLAASTKEFVRQSRRVALSRNGRLRGEIVVQLIGAQQMVVLVLVQGRVRVRVPMVEEVAGR